MNYDEAAISSDEKIRIVREHRRREAEIDSTRYAPWQPGESFMVSERKRIAASMLYRRGAFPKAGDKCLEIGYGTMGWLPDLLSWGVNENDLHGIELDGERANAARKRLPAADLRTGDASKLPWEGEYFKLIVLSTVFSSILSDDVRRLVAGEADRVLRSGGAIIWYDLAVGNPKNPNVRKIDAGTLSELFPRLDATTRSITLAPPLARAVAPRSFAVTALLSALPFLRTHLIGVLIKK